MTLRGNGSPGLIRTDASLGIPNCRERSARLKWASAASTHDNNPELLAEDIAE
jgi:hypothetical protein